VAELQSWKRLRAGDPGDVILAVDFSGTGRLAGTFSELAPKLTPGPEIWETLSPAAETGDTMTGDQYADRWITEVRAAGPRVRAVLGFCVGSMFAAALLEPVSRGQDTPAHLIVFDPEKSVIAGMHRDFARCISGQLSTILTPEEIIDARQAGADAVQAASGDIVAAGRGLRDVFRKWSGTAADRIGLHPDLVGQLTGAFDAYMTYLRAASQVDPAPGLAHATAITSAGTKSAAHLAAREVKVPVHHRDILRDDSVAQTIRSILAGTDTTAPQPGQAREQGDL
jgi:hypothetical protein